MSINHSAVLLFGLVGILMSQSASSQKIAVIALKDEKLGFTPAEYYIGDIIDQRQGQVAVASLIRKGAENAYVVEPAELEGGTTAAVKKFIAHNLDQDSKQKAIVISIKQFRLNETAEQGGMITGHLSVDFSFGLQKSYGVLHLTDYKSGIDYERSAGADLAERTLREGIVNALVWFDQWIDKNAGTDPRLAGQVKVWFTDYTENPEGDTIYYSVKRPLTWADFREGVMDNAFQAEVFTSIGYTEKMTVNKGVINLAISLKVDLPKNDCLVKPGGRDDYALNHEQRHFDIAKIVAERFKHKIVSMQLPVDNYDGPIDVQYLKTLRELTAMQKQYDNETHHGLDRTAQAEWDKKIDEELKKYGLRN